MGIENQNFGTIKLEENFLPPAFLEEQVQLPKEKWDHLFTKYIEKLSKENQENISQSETNILPPENSEDSKNRTFSEYLDRLKINEELLKDKKIIDLGCGSEGEFVESILEKNISTEIYGIDSRIKDSSIGKFNGHLIRGDYTNELCIKGADLILSMNSVTSCIEGIEKEKDQEYFLEKIIKNCIISIKEGGEIKMYPLRNSAEATPIIRLKEKYENWKTVLNKMSLNNEIKYNIEPIYINVTAIAHNILLPRS